MPTKREQIIFEALNILNSELNGIRCSELCKKIKQKHSNITLSYIKSIIVKLDKLKPYQVYKLSRKFFIHVKHINLEEVTSEQLVKQFNEIISSTTSSKSKANINRLIPVKYHNRVYPDHINPRITGVAAHFDIKEIRQDGLLSIHTEYSYGRRRLDSNLPRKFSALKLAHRDCVPMLWRNRQWSIDFAEFIKEFVSNKTPVVIEIHPPFNDYSTFDTFLENYEEFEKIIINEWPNVDILIENRSGTEYSGGAFLISRINDLKEFVKKLDQTALKLKIALDIPQLFTAHGGPFHFNNSYLREFLLSLEGVIHRIKGIHLWGKRRSSSGRWVSHVGDLNSYFNNDHNKKVVFLNTFAELLRDGETKYFVPEVNSSDHDLHSIVRDLEDAGIDFEVS